MITKRICCALNVFLVSLATTAPLRAETMAFPKNNPVFTFEVPKNWSAKFSGGAMVFLRSITAGDVKEFTLTEMPSGVHDKESAEKHLVTMIKLAGDSRGITDVQCSPFEEAAFHKGITGFSATCPGKQWAGLDKVDVENAGTAFSLDGKRFFMMKTFGLPGSDGAMHLVGGSVTAAK